MKYSLVHTVGSILLVGSVASAEFVGFHLVEIAVDGFGSVPGTTTWRLYAEFDDVNDQLTNVGGSPTSNGAIQSNTGFYQNAFCGSTSSSVHPWFASMFPSMLFDSWVTIQLDDMTGNSLTHTGIDFTDFEWGNDLFINDGSWFLQQNDPQALVYELDGFDNYHSLVGQFTTFGYGPETAPWGQLNLSGFSTDGSGVQTPWSFDGATFGTPIPAPATLLLVGIAGTIRRRRR